MALIKCPECGKEISDKAPACIHCGYPINSVSTVAAKPKSYNVIFKGFSRKVDTPKSIGQLRGVLKSDIATAKRIIEKPNSIIQASVSLENAQWIQQVLSPSGFIVEIVESQSEINKEKNENLNKRSATGGTIVCPHCGSTAISTGARGYSIVSGFIGSGKTVNRCAHCGWKWTP